MWILGLKKKEEYALLVAYGRCRLSSRLTVLKKNIKKSL